MKRTLLPLTLLAFLLSACSAWMQPAASPLPPLRVEYTQWWGDYTLLVAQEKGFFEKYGVQVEPVYYNVFTESYIDLAAGQIDAALIASGDAININRHMPVLIVGISDDGGYMPIVARPEIKTIGDLRGKNIGTLIGTQYELMALEMLASAGLTSADVKIKNVNPEEVADAMSKNEIQAGFSWEPFTSQALQQGGRVLYPTDNSLRLFPDTIVFRRSVAEQRPEDIRAFLQAWFEAANYRLKNEEETRLIAAQYIGAPTDQIQPDNSLKIYTHEDNLFSYAEPLESPNSIYNIAQKTAAYLLSSGTISAMPDLESILTNEFIPVQQ